MFTEFLIKAGLALFILGNALNFAGLLTWVERKQSAVMQDRIGANRARIEFKSKWLLPVNWLLAPLNALGIFHALADAIKMFVKEDFMPRGADRFLHTLAQAISVIFALVAFAAIPFGDVWHIGGRLVNLQVSGLN